MNACIKGGSVGIVALALVALFGCSESGTVNPTNTAPPPHVAHGPLNPDNPYDSVGIIHNEQCEFYMGYIAETDTTIAQVWAHLSAAVQNLGTNEGWGQPYIDALLDSAKAQWNRLDASYDPIEELQSYNSGGAFTEREVQYMNRIGFAFEVAQDSIVLMDSVSQIEADVNTESWNTDESAARSVISIAKHSFCFWGGFFNWAYEWNIYTACMDADAYSKGRRSGDSKKEASDLSAIFSLLAAEGWEPGTELP